MRNFHIVISVALAISAIFTEPLLGQELIDNGHFDTGIEGWIADEFPDGGTIAWASDPGQPPGALKFVGDGQVARPTECFQFNVAGELTYSMDVFMETTGDFFSCTLNLNLYKDANDCTGNFAVIAEIPRIFHLPEATIPNQWQELVFELPLPENPAEATNALSYQPVILKDFDENGDDACIFDNVSLVFTPAPQNITEVPVTSPVGLGIFAGLLALGAGLVLRRGSGS